MGQPVLSPPVLDEAGKTHALDDFAGRVVLLNIWATWCPLCRKEMPSLDRLEGAVGGAGFMVLPLCIDDEGIGRGRAFYDETGITLLPLYWGDPLRVGLALGFVGLPTTLLIDRRGLEVGRRQGPTDWNRSEVAAQIRGVL